MAKKYTSKLFEFSFCANYDDKIKNLASLADSEKWNFNESSHNGILKNYIEHTFRKLQEENKIACINKNANACFNTGLVTSNLEEIYALFEKNTNPKAQSPFFMIDFVKKSDYRLLRIFTSSLPERADFFSEPHDLIFNPNHEIVADIDHIIQDNKHRFPKSLVNSGDDNLRRQLEGSIQEVIKLVKTNYKVAIPQYFNGKTQLLLPLCLTPGSKEPDLALVLFKYSPTDTKYCARSCLTLEMAYTNARLIVKPQSEWLKA